MPGDPRRDDISLEREFLAESLLSTVLKFLDFKMRWHLLNPIMYSCGPDCFQANKTIYKCFIQRGQEPDLKRTFSGSTTAKSWPKADRELMSEARAREGKQRVSFGTILRHHSGTYLLRVRYQSLTSRAALGSPGAFWWLLLAIPTLYTP